MFNEVLKFWFEEIDPKMWWIADPIFDGCIKDRFVHLLNQAEKGELYGWRKEPKGRLAEIIVLDQFSRNIYRNTPKAFSNDAMALVLAQEAVRLEVPKLLSATECTFLFVPYMHSDPIFVIAGLVHRRFVACGAGRGKMMIGKFRVKVGIPIHHREQIIEVLMFIGRHILHDHIPGHNLIIGD